MIVISLLAAAITLLSSIDRVPDYYKRRKGAGNDRYKIPPLFWDEYNKISLAIYDMKYDTCEHIRSQIDDFAFRWHEFVDFHAYNDRIHQLFSDYRKKEKQLLSNNF